jgi:subtilase family serine protease
VRPCLEQLEGRCVPSASSAAWVAAPDLDVRPLAGLIASAPYTPAQMRHAYGFDRVAFSGGVNNAGAGQTIAIVDAFDDPNVLSDLKKFDATFGLPDPPKFTKVGMGAVTADADWANEIALDVEWAHAIAPKANILLVEAPSANDSALLAAVDYARNAAGVSVVSMSWGGAEFWGESGYDYHFTTPAGHTGVTFVAAAGDGGAGAEWPAASPRVLAVGGTTLTLGSGGAYVGETGWAGGGGGDSRYEAEPSYQRGVQSSGVRSIPDVAYDADPNTGVFVYITAPGAASGAWFSYGGTSAGAPQWAALIAIADQGRAVGGQGPLDGAQSQIYALSSWYFHDVTAGDNGFAAHAGYDLVTGRGTPFADRIISALLGAASSSTTTAATTRTGTTGTSGAAAKSAARMDAPTAQAVGGENASAARTDDDRFRPTDGAAPRSERADAVLTEALRGLREMRWFAARAAGDAGAGGAAFAPADDSLFIEW